MTETATPFEPQPLGDRYFQDPLRVFARMREQSPVTSVITPEGQRAWLITRYEDVRKALADPRLSKDWRKLRSPGFVPDPSVGFLMAHMLNADPPDHTRLRRLVQKAFTPGRVAALRPRIEAITASLLDAMAEGGSGGGPGGGGRAPDDAREGVVDLIAAFAFPLPMTVICELLGIPDGDREEFKTWSQVILSSTATFDEYRAAGGAMYAYFTRLLADKRAAPADDLLSALITARDSGDSLDEPELLAMIFLLLVAGHETTVNLIATGTLALLTHPSELSRLRAEPSLLPGAIEELLRYANPLNHATDRYAPEPLEVGGVMIPADEPVLVVTSSANRDPARFPDPDRLDLGRDASGHVAFGHGIHYCVGAPLARLEGEIAFGALLSRFPGLSLAVDPAALRWRPSSLIHGLETLPVRLR
jgi:cytochrome P450